MSDITILYMVYLKVPKTLHTCFKRRIWLYDRGNYYQYRDKLQRVDWDELILILEIA